MFCVFKEDRATLPLGKYNKDEMSFNLQEGCVVFSFVKYYCCVHQLCMFDQGLSSEKESWMIFHVWKIEDATDPKLELDARHEGKLLRGTSGRVERMRKLPWVPGKESQLRYKGTVDPREASLEMVPGEGWHSERCTCSLSHPGALLSPPLVQSYKSQGEWRGEMK
jgi:hypothetical protein